MQRRPDKNPIFGIRPFLLLPGVLSKGSFVRGRCGWVTKDGSKVLLYALRGHMISGRSVVDAENNPTNDGSGDS